MGSASSAIALVMLSVNRTRAHFRQSESACSNMPQAITDARYRSLSEPQFAIDLGSAASL